MPTDAVSFRLRWIAALALAAVAMFLVACGDDDDDSTSAGDGDSAETAKVAIDVSGAGKSVSFSVPKGIEAGLTELTLNNETKRPEDVQLVLVKGDHPRDAVVKAFQAAGSGKALPDWFLAAGGVGTTAPGKTRSVTQLLEPGNYYAVSTATNKFAAFEVSGEPSDAELPETDGTVSAFEYGFEADGLKPGENELVFENTGTQLHHIVAAQINKGATIEQVEEFVSTQQGGGKPPADFDNAVSTAVLEGGTSQVTDLKLQAGRYALLCFVSDRTGGPPHVAKGMVSEVEVE